MANAAWSWSERRFFIFRKKIGSPQNSASKMAEDAEVRAIFGSLDEANKGYIDVRDLSRVLPTTSEEQLKQVVEALDSTGKGQIGFGDFRDNFASFERLGGAGGDTDQTSRGVGEGHSGEVKRPSVEAVGALGLEVSRRSTLFSRRGSADVVSLAALAAHLQRRRASAETRARRDSISQSRRSDTKASSSALTHGTGITSDASEDVGPFIIASADASSGGGEGGSSGTGTPPPRHLDVMALVSERFEPGTHEMVGELLQRNRMLETRVKSFFSERRRAQRLAFELHESGDAMRAKDKTIIRLKRAAEDLRARLATSDRANRGLKDEIGQLRAKVRVGASRVPVRIKRSQTLGPNVDTGGVYQDSKTKTIGVRSSTPPRDRRTVDPKPYRNDPKHGDSARGDAIARHTYATASRAEFTPASHALHLLFNVPLSHDSHQTGAPPARTAETVILQCEMGTVSPIFPKVQLVEVKRKEKSGRSVSRRGSGVRTEPLLMNVGYALVSRPGGPPPAPAPAVARWIMQLSYGLAVLHATGAAHGQLGMGVLWLSPIKYSGTSSAQSDAKGMNLRLVPPTQLLPCTPKNEREDVKEFCGLIRRLIKISARIDEAFWRTRGQDVMRLLLKTSPSTDVKTPTMHPPEPPHKPCTFRRLFGSLRSCLYHPFRSYVTLLIAAETDARVKSSSHGVIDLDASLFPLLTVRTRDGLKTQSLVHVVTSFAHQSNPHRAMSIECPLGMSGYSRFSAGVTVIQALVGRAYASLWRFEHKFNGTMAAQLPRQATHDKSWLRSQSCFGSRIHRHSAILPDNPNECIPVCISRSQSLDAAVKGMLERHVSNDMALPTDDGSIDIEEFRRLPILFISLQGLDTGEQTQASQLQMWPNGKILFFGAHVSIASYTLHGLAPSQVLGCLNNRVNMTPEDHKTWKAALERDVQLAHCLSDPINIVRCADAWRVTREWPRRASATSVRTWDLDLVDAHARYIVESVLPFFIPRQVRAVLKGPYQDVMDSFVRFGGAVAWATLRRMPLETHRSGAYIIVQKSVSHPDTLRSTRYVGAARWLAISELQRSSFESSRERDGYVEGGDQADDERSEGEESESEWSRTVLSWVTDRAWSRLMTRMMVRFEDDDNDESSKFAFSDERAWLFLILNHLAAVEKKQIPLWSETLTHGKRTDSRSGENETRRKAISRACCARPFGRPSRSHVLWRLFLQDPATDLNAAYSAVSELVKHNPTLAAILDTAAASKSPLSVVAACIKHKME